MTSNACRFRFYVLLPALVLALAAGGCGSHGSTGSTASPAASAAPTAAATPYLGIERIDKGYIPALKKNVLVVTLTQKPRGADPNGIASAVYDSIKASLVQSNFNLAVIKIPMTQTSNSSSAAVVIYARDSKGEWARTDDPAIVEAVDRAGL